MTKDEITVSPEEVLSLPWVLAGVANLRSTRLGYELEIGPYVGTLLIGSEEIVVAELVPGTVSACLELSRTGRKIGEQSSYSNRTLTPNDAVARAYTDAVASCLQNGVLKEYSDLTALTSRPRGRLLIRDSIRRPWSHGKENVMVATWRHLSEDTPLNRTLLAAGIRAQYLLPNNDVGLKLLRECIISLSGAQLQSAPDLVPLEGISDPVTARAISLARTILDGVPDISPTSTQSTSRFSAWINVARVFEEAIFSICRNLHPLSTFVGSSLGVSLFHNDTGTEQCIAKRADPDIVLKLEHGTLILDAKYRRSGEKVSDDAIYQLIAHADAFSARAATIVTPAIVSPPQVRRLGQTRGGCSIFTISVDPTRVIETELLIQAWISSRLSELENHPA
ncbi:5-methylcytosine restriction system specificity protein McrC [Williamsia sp. R60]